MIYQEKYSSLQFQSGIETGIGIRSFSSLLSLQFKYRSSATGETQE